MGLFWTLSFQRSNPHYCPLYIYSNIFEHIQIFSNTFKYLWTHSNILEHTQIFWTHSNIFERIQVHISEHTQSILKTFNIFCTHDIYFFTVKSENLEKQNNIMAWTPKRNYWISRIGLMGTLSSLQKSVVLKLIISFFHYFWCQNWDQWHKMSEKHTHVYFFNFWLKNKRVWLEKIGKKWTNSRNLKVAGNYPNSH